MADVLVDTSVLIVGSAAVEPGYADVAVDAESVELVFEWLREFRDDAERRLALDELFRIFQEYNNKLNGQHFGLQVVHHKLATSCLRTVAVDYDDHGFGIVPEGLAEVDDSDKKFVAAALNDPENLPIVNATDADWREQAEALRAHGVIVVELLA